MRGHRIQFPHDLGGLFNVIDDPHQRLPGPTTHKEALSGYKVVCVAPQENEYMLRKIVNESKDFTLDGKGARGYARVFRLYNSHYQSDMREDVRGPSCFSNPNRHPAVTCSRHLCGPAYCKLYSNVVTEHLKYSST
jgi:hypothetical protein